MEKLVIEKPCGCLSVNGADAIECYVHAQIGAVIVFMCGVAIFLGAAFLFGM